VGDISHDVLIWVEGDMDFLLFSFLSILFVLFVLGCFTVTANGGGAGESQRDRPLEAQQGI
jgi:hypothetical protein